MTDEFPDLENDLRRFTPAVPPGNLADSLARQLDAAPRRPWSDRCLTGAIALGLAASVVIVSLLGTDWIAANRQPPPRPHADSPSVVQTRDLLIQLALGSQLRPSPSATAPN